VDCRCLLGTSGSVGHVPSTSVRLDRFAAEGVESGVSQARPPGDLTMKRVLAVGVVAASVAVGGVFGVGSAVAVPLAAGALPNQNVAGYSLALRSVPSTLSVSGQFLVPAVSSCGASESGVAFWAATATGGGQSALGGADIDETGVLVQCKGGVPVYQGFTSVEGTYSSLPVAVAAGDRITVAVSTTGSGGVGAVTATFQDATRSYSTAQTGTNKHFECPRNLPCAGALGAVLTQNSMGQPLPIPAFGHVAFSHALLGGQTPAAATPTQLRWDNLVNPSGTLQIATSKLNTAGNGWTERFKHA
jgi:hypothetical protein